MSLSKRLYNLARAEVTAAFKKLKDEPGASDEELRRIQEELRHLELETERSHSTADQRFPPEICRYYGNLELPIGAPADEVRTAYRRLMRRYHPDRHYGDERKEKLANQLSSELRTAYEKIMAHLGES